MGQVKASQLAGILIVMSAVGSMASCAGLAAGGGGASPAKSVESQWPSSDSVATEGVDSSPEKAVSSETDTFDPCEWRKCALTGHLVCEDSGWVCDMYRNECVPVCEDEQCCDGVVCPDGTVCVPGLGRCGIPVGDGCYDLGMDWWTGRDLPPNRRPAIVEEVPAVFVVHNSSGRPLYLEATQTQPLRFDLYVEYCGHLQKLEISENHFCPTLCPPEGRPMEVDCGPPPRIVRCLPAGESISVEWSGREQVGMWRFCGPPRARYCLVDRVTLPGIYIFEIHAFASYEGGQIDPADANRIVGANPSGELRRFQVEFQHPTKDIVEMHLGDD